MLVVMDLDWPEWYFSIFQDVLGSLSRSYTIAIGLLPEHYIGPSREKGGNPAVCGDSEHQTRRWSQLWMLCFFDKNRLKTARVRSLISCSAFLVNVLLVSAEPRAPPGYILCGRGRYGTPPPKRGYGGLPPESFEISE